MVNFKGHYMMVFNPQIKLDVSECMVFANLTSSRKDSRTDPPVYYRSTWFDVAFVGEAFEPAKALRGGEKIDVVRGMMTNEKNPNTGQYHTKVVVFEFALSQLSRGGNTEE